MTIRFISLIVLSVILFNTSFTQYFGSNKNDAGVSFCEHNGEFFLTGTTRGFGYGSEDIWMLNVDKDLQVNYHVEWGGEHHDIAAKIISTSDNNLLVAGHSWDTPGGRTGVSLIKFSTIGGVLWTSNFGGYHNDYAYGLYETSDKGYLLTGINRAEGSIGAAFLIKTNKYGQLQWQKFYDTDYKDIGIDVVESEDKTSLFLLATINSFTSKIANSSEYLSPDASQIMLIKTDNLGNERWRKFFGGAQHDFAKKIVSDNQNGCYFIGTSMDNSNGSFDMILYRIDETGNVLWQQNYGGEGYEYGNDLDIDGNGNLLLTGTSSSFSDDENTDIFIVKVNPDGDEIWSETYGGLDSDYGNSGNFLSDGSIGILGSSKSKEGSDLDLFFIKLSSTGEVLDQIKQAPTIPGKQIELYPNPANTHVNIVLGEDIDDGIIEFMLYNLSGVILDRTQSFGASKRIVFDTLLPSGIYGYRIKVNEYSTNGKLVIIQ